MRERRRVSEIEVDYRGAAVAVVAMVAAAFLGFTGGASWATQPCDCATDEPARTSHRVEVYRSALARRDSMFGECREALVEHQDRLRRIGHRWTGERWVPVRGGSR